MTNPWDRHSGAFDRPSSSVPGATADVSGDARPDAAEAGDAAERYRGIVSIAGDLVGEYGLSGALDVVESIAAAARDEQRDATATELVSYLERVERLIEERKAINSDIKDVLKEANGRGFNVPTMRWMIERRAKDPDEVREGDALLAIYEESVGGLPVRVPLAAVEPDTPAPKRKESARSKALREARAFASAASTTTH
ncbi:DUF2312 domain-containing protein [Sphingomonas arantia]|uniref:DUF2312 domain-containing protein n=1 Tax=Sphingomonas arantia TaxID=1460676 RepID=A0ABW4TYS1_9SPHN